jgi:tRNA A37 threonylcarbamoyladenosine dehydratase
MQHAFSRFEMLVGQEAIEKLKNSTVAVFGVGGVGSFAVEGLVRSGVGKFILVDDDLVCLTNLNRQLHATRKSIGKPKVDVMKERILDINPKAEVVTHRLFYLPQTAGTLLDGDIDYIIDAIDTVTAKIDLVLKAREKGIPILSSMGTGNKFDPTKLMITDISKTSVDPLAKVMRKELRARGITSLKVLFSEEPPSKTRETVRTSCKENCVCPAGTDRKCTDRRNIPGSSAFVPPAAGLIIASEVVKDLLGGAWNQES